LGYFADRRDSETLALLNDALTRCDKSDFAYKVMQFFRGDITEQELFDTATGSYELTFAKTYLGLRSYYSSLTGSSSPNPQNQLAMAQKHLDWVLQNGNKDSVEYSLARAYKQRIDAAGRH
jgi:hypothetical protein